MQQYSQQNIHLLAGLYPEAKNIYRKILLEDQSFGCRGHVFNNLALACWWHKHPSFRRNFSESSHIKGGIKNYSESLIRQDFKEVISLFRKAVHQIQIKRSHSGLNKSFIEGLGDILNQVREPSDYSLSLHKCSVTSLLNLNEFILLFDLQKKNQAIMYLRLAIQTADKEDSINMQRCLLLMANICHKAAFYQKADKLFQILRQQLKARRSHLTVDYLRAHSKRLREERRTSESEQFLKESFELEKELGSWLKGQKYVMLQECDL